MSMQKADEAKKGSGWTNLLNHIKTQHPDYDKDDGKQQRIDNYVSLTKKANNLEAILTTETYSSQYNTVV